MQKQFLFEMSLKRQHLSGGWPALFRPNSVEYEQLGKSWNPWWKDCLPTDPRCSWWTLHRRGAYYLQLWFQSGYYPAEGILYMATNLSYKLHHRRPQTVCAFQIETRARDAQSWETKDCVQSGRTHLKKELTSPNSKPFGELFFKCEHDAGHAAQSAGS